MRLSTSTSRPLRLTRRVRMLDAPPAPSSSTKPSAGTCSTWPTQRAESAGPATAPTTQRIRPSVHAMLDAITGGPAVVRSGGLDILQPTPSGARCTPSSTSTRSDRPTTPGTPSWTPALRTSGSTGNEPPTTPLGFFGPKRGATPTTRPCPISSENCPPTARSFAPAGPSTTSTCTAPAPRRSATPPSACSSSTTRRCSSPPTPA